MRIGTAQRRGSARSVRVMLPGLVAILMLVQILSSFGTAFARPSLGDFTAVGAVAAHDVSCLRPDAAGGDKSPAQERHNCADCCIFCSGRECAAALIQDDWTAGLAVQERRASARISRRFHKNADRYPIGWASSWSSRAPPSFS